MSQLTNDIMLVIGIVLAVLSIPAILSAMSGGRSPRRAAIVVLIAGGLIVIAAYTRDGGLAFADVPAAFVNVVGSVVN